MLLSSPLPTVNKRLGARRGRYGEPQRQLPIRPDAAVGLLASRTRADNIAQARRLLDVPATQPEAGDANGAEANEPKPLSHPCPCCGGRMIIIERFRRDSSPRYRPATSAAVIRIDTS